MKICSKCKRELDESRFNKANWIKSGLRSDCKDCYSAFKKSWYQENHSPPNRHRLSGLKIEALAGVRTCKGCQTTYPLNEDHYGRRALHWEVSCRKCVRERTSEWAKANSKKAKALAYATCAARYAAIRKRRPRWLTKSEKSQIRSIYAAAKARRNSGENVHVDHIVPLVGGNVSGLHVPWNLQVIPATENARKSNTWNY
jgi:hypothetical protein